MPKRLTKVEIYISWFVIAMINLSSDVVLDLVFNLYSLNGGKVQLSVHFIEWTLSASYGIIYLNFLPHKRIQFIIYLFGWLLYSCLFEYMLVHFNFINYSGWKLWFSVPYYLFALLFMKWHLKFIKSENKT